MQLNRSNNTVSLIPAIDGDIQIAVGSSGLIVLDVQGAHRSVNGNLIHDHGVVRLTYSAALALRDLLDEISEPVDQRQRAFPAIWGDASYSSPMRVRGAQS